MRNYKELQDQITNGMSDLEQRRFFHKHFTHSGKENQSWVINASDLEVGDVITSFFGLPFVITQISDDRSKFDAKIERRWNATYDENYILKNVEFPTHEIRVFAPNTI